MDREILADDPLTDLTTVASPGTSLLLLEEEEPRPSPPQTPLSVGDSVTVRVILRDVTGRPVLRGGHEVSVWVVGKSARRRAAAVEARDLGDGTYVARVPALWAGPVEVRAALNRPREFRRLLLLLMDRMKTLQQLAAAFVNGHTEQVFSSSCDIYIYIYIYNRHG